MHNRFVTTPCRGKSEITTVTLSDPTTHTSATKTRSSEEQVAEYSSASTIVGTAFSPYLDVSRLKIVLN